MKIAEVLQVDVKDLLVSNIPSKTEKVIIIQNS